TPSWPPCGPSGRRPPRASSRRCSPSTTRSGPSWAASPSPASTAGPAAAATCSSPPWRATASGPCRPRSRPGARSAGASSRAEPAVVLWFVGPSILAVWAVFGSPAADYRLVALGSLVPLLEVPFGEPRALHSLTGAAAVLVLVMLGARG